MQLAVVVDANGSVTYDNRPQNVGEYADWITGSAGSDVITLPASAFPSPEVEYLVGIAGVERAEDGEYNGFNPLVSNLAIGAFATWPLLTSP